MTTQPAKPIHWTPAEWTAVAEALLTARPSILFDYGSISPRELGNAIATMPAGRQRKIPNGTTITFRPRLYAALDALKDGKVNIPPEVSKPRKVSVYWKDSEYLSMARRIHKLNPQLIDSPSLTGLRPADVEFAQQILPEDRHRKIVTMVPERPRFLAAFDTLRPLIAEEQRQLAAFKKQKAAGLYATPPAPEPVVEPVAPPAPVAPPVAVAPIAAPASIPLNEYEAALRPLVALITAHVTASLAPILNALQCDAAHGLPPVDVSALMASLRAGPPVPMAAPIATPVAPAEKEPPKPRKMRIGIVGPKANQARDLEADYPSIEFTIVEANTKQARRGSLGRVDRVIGMVDFMGHGVDHALTREYGDLYCRASGGVASLKRQINLWLHQGVVAA